MMTAAQRATSSRVKRAIEVAVGRYKGRESAAVK
jgi:hypothetical protein